MPIFRSGPHSSTRSSRSSRRYRESTHLIPTPGVETLRPERHVAWPLSTWKVLTLAIFMILLGIGIEIALAFSRQNNGFPVPSTNVFTFVQPSFLTAFFPTLLVFPLSYFWGVADRVLRWYQPYVVLSQGGARAEDSIMIDYVMSKYALSFVSSSMISQILGSLLVSLWRSLKRREWLIHVSMITALAATFYQPLAGALLSIQQVPKSQVWFINSITSLGLSQDASTLNPFLAAAGFAEAAAFQGLPDPPFVSGGWAVSQFIVDTNQGLNASLTTQRTSVRTDAGCTIPPTITLNTDNSSNYTITTVDADGCTSVAMFNPASADQQYGTSAANPETCGLDPNTEIDFVPVVFWFFHTSDNGKQEARAVMCRPKLELFNVEVVVNANNKSLTSVEILNNYTTPNNITGSPLNGKAYNAVLFNSTNMNDFVRARAVAIQAQIPGAIFRFASQDPDTLEQFFEGSSEFLPLTKQIYTQHLAVSALSVYFINEHGGQDGLHSSLVERLIMDALAAHALSALLMVIGLAGVVIHLCHRHVRRKLYLTAAPGTIASVISLTSHSGFGELLYPYDDERTMRAKLANLRFSLDHRTGAIIADEFAYDEGMSESMRRHMDLRAEEDTKMELQSITSATGLLPDSSKVDVETTPPQLRSMQELPYEHEPLMSSRDPQMPT